MSELKPCPNPWCPESAPVADEIYPGAGWFARCKSCDINTPIAATEAEAIAAWNTRRPTPAGVSELADELEQLAAKATPGPWAYRPDQYDDWGAVKAGPDEEGRRFWIAQIRDPRVHEDEDLNRHRRDGTDPWEANARLVVLLENNLPDILSALRSMTDEGGER